MRPIRNEREEWRAARRRMVGLWGMNDEIGPIIVINDDEMGAPMSFYPGAETASQATLQKVDEEVRKLVEGAHQEVTKLLNEKRVELDALSQELLEEETLEQEEAYRTVGLEPPKSREEVEVEVKGEEKVEGEVKAT